MGQPCCSVAQMTVACDQLLEEHVSGCPGPFPEDVSPQKSVCLFQCLMCIQTFIFLRHKQDRRTYLFLRKGLPWLFAADLASGDSLETLRKTLVRDLSHSSLAQSSEPNLQPPSGLPVTS